MKKIIGFWLMVAVAILPCEARRRWIPPMVSGATTNLTANTWQSFEFATLTTGNLSGSDHNGANTWTITDASSLFTAAVTSAQHNMISTVNTVADTGTRGLSWTWSAAATSFLQCQLNTAPGSSPGSFGFWFFIPTTSADFSGTKIFTAYNVGAIFIRRNGGTLYINGDAGLTGVNPTDNAWYWITAQFQQSSTCTIRVYNASGVQVGSDVTFAGLGGSLGYFMVGCLDTTPSNGLVFKYDNVVFNSSGTFPLGP